MTGPEERFSAIRSFRNLTHYLAFLKDLVRDSVRRYPKMAAIVIGSSVAGILFQAISFIVLLSYVSAIANDQAFTLPGGYSFGSRGSIQDMVLTLAVISAGLLASAYFIHRANLLTIRMGRLYERYCSDRILDLASPKVVGCQSLNAEPIDLLFLHNLARKDSLVRGRVMRIIMTMAYPFLAFLVAFCAMLYLHMSLTMAVAVIASLSLIFQARTSRLAVSSSRRMEQYSKPASKALNRAIRKAIEEPTKPNSKDGKPPVHSQEGKLFEIAFDDRLRSIEASRVVGTVTLSLILALILATLGIEVILYGTGWQVLLSYVIASRFCLMGFQSLLLSLTSINRFYPQLLRYSHFVSTVE